ncbi:pilus assembly protein PilM [Candidatus Kaiserbacteria bacterium]|nr:pilus assembly protein PilM [Candidatus Kaiserbacteria bacterium]
MSFLSSVNKILPPASFLEMRSIGVDISDTSLKYIKCVPNQHAGEGFLVSDFGDVDIESGALHRGVVNDQSKLTDALKEVKERSKAEMVRVSLPEERAYLFETTIDRNTSHKDILGLLEFKLEENVPLSPRDAFFDYEFIPSISEQKNVAVLVTVYARETVQSYYEACRAAELIPLSFEVEAQAIARASIPKNDTGTHMIIDFGKTRTGVGIVHRGVLLYTSTIEIGGADVSSAMREVIGDLEEGELTKIKNTQGLVPNKENPALTKAISKSIDSIADELKVRIQYWNSKNSSDEDRYLESAILCGGSVNMKGIQRYLTDSLDLDSVRADVWGNVFIKNQDVPPIEQRFAYGYATAVGLALGSYL